MKRFASNYIYIPEKGFLKQCVAEVTDSGILNRISPLTEEIASVSWLPGLLILVPYIENTDIIERAISIISGNEEKLISDCIGKQVGIVHAYPFDFNGAHPYPHTKYQLIE